MLLSQSFWLIVCLRCIVKVIAVISSYILSQLIGCLFLNWLVNCLLSQMVFHLLLFCHKLCGCLLLSQHICADCHNLYGCSLLSQYYLLLCHQFSGSHHSHLYFTLFIFFSCDRTPLDLAGGSLVFYLYLSSSSLKLILHLASS